MWWLTSPVLQRSILMKQRGGDMARRSSVDRLVRLLALPAWVADNDGATFQEAAAHFGVTPEVIRRDVETLWVSGLPGGMPGDLVDFSAHRVRSRASEPDPAPGAGSAGAVIAPGGDRSASVSARAWSGPRGRPCFFSRSAGCAGGAHQGRQWRCIWYSSCNGCRRGPWRHCVSRAIDGSDGSGSH